MHCVHQQAGELRLHGWLNRERMPVRVQSRVLPHRQQLHCLHHLQLANQLRGFRLSGWRREQRPRLCTVALTAAAAPTAASTATTTSFTSSFSTTTSFTTCTTRYALLGSAG